MPATKGHPVGFNMNDWLDALASADGLTLRELRVLLVMSRYASWSTGRDIRPSTTTVSERARVSIGNLRGKGGALASLVAKGWLVQTCPATNTAPAVYRLDVPTVGTSPNQGRAHAGDVPTAKMDVPESVRFDVPESVRFDVPTVGTQPIHDLSMTNAVTSPRDTRDAATVDAEVVEDHDGEPEPATLDIATPPPEPPATDGVAVRNSMDDAIEACEKLAAFLAGRVSANTGLQVRPTKAWVQAMSSLMAKGATPQDIAQTIDYATKDQFWSGIIVNPSSLTANYLRVASKARAHGRPDLGRDSRPSWTREKYRLRDVWAAKLEDEENNQEPNEWKGLTS